MAKLFHVNSNAKANDENGPTNDALWLGILNIAIQAGNHIHDSITGGRPINFPVDEAIVHLNGSIGQTKIEETLDIGFINENPLVPQSSLSFYLERLANEPSSLAAIVIVNHMTICFVARDEKLFILDSHLHFPHGAMVGVTSLETKEEFLSELKAKLSLPCNICSLTFVTFL